MPHTPSRSDTPAIRATFAAIVALAPISPTDAIDAVVGHGHTRHACDAALRWLIASELVKHDAADDFLYVETAPIHRGIGN